MSFETGTYFDNVTIEDDQPPPKLTHYESQKRRDWKSFCQFLKIHDPPVPLEDSNSDHVVEFMKYLDQFGKTKVHLHGCDYFGKKEPPEPCNCPLKQAWGSLDALIGRLRAAYEENGGNAEMNPFACGGVKAYLREVKELQSIARGVSYVKKKKNIIGDQSTSYMN
ncbi:hypothetical protein LIER_04025 [Lithospermum erythrorhizon]|uniref:ALOG domain-containing protein n=1 Tax=Lithospermum erythrorhizon TaxID=34254 RepID=A0AAV3NWJ6_LITER